MVDYDTAVATVQDSNADPVMLAKVAYENPDFGANVAANPRAYPGLKRWLAQFGDDRARETLKSMGFDVPAQAVTPQEAQPQAVNTGTPYIADQQQAGAGYTAAQAQPAANANAYAAQQTPVATNAYGYTAEQALDPNTDQMTIASIAQYAPELRPCLARNPNTYPELLNWLAQLHDPAIDAALATRQ
ncbi:hypothetical protein OZX73_07370 [Bifidobacterium sp. ESL0775]|uniref:variant leucine-rich repeat-containing protein n=1 Tax=Bifidobacterium sp. ESL0775 TaxID=2983230 RepID=UPI0023F6B491|nr:hypothetical protein [Bifidobacterium sp. ESL0775]WEV69069.1 hypothetical protein OZX73_07370 [Bifidobacterium sp. ESL0775]